MINLFLLYYRINAPFFTKYLVYWKINRAVNFILPIYKGDLNVTLKYLYFVV